jgi:HEPN domain-containing protein
MPLDPVRVADVQAWLRSAYRDLGAGEHDLTARPPYTGDAMFHAQQAVEKVLKGFLAWNEVPFRKTHDIRELLRACIDIDSSLQTMDERAESLSPFAWVFRDPGDAQEPPIEEARDALELAREVVGAVSSRLPEAVRP